MGRQIFSGNGFGIRSRMTACRIAPVSGGRSTAPRSASAKAGRFWGRSMLALMLILISTIALADVRYDEYRGTGNVPANPAVPNYVNDLPGGTANESPRQLQNLVDFAAASPANIAATGTAPQINWLNSASALCGTNKSTPACLRWIQGRVVYAVIRFPTVGQYQFSVAHDDELRINFSTTFSAANAANFRNFDYNVPVGELGSWTANDSTFVPLPGNFSIREANSCYVARIYWNNQGGDNHLRLRWTPPGGTATIIPASQLGDPQDPASYQGCANIPTDLGIAKTGPATYVAGTPFSYTIKVWNYGPVAATGAMFSDTLPASLSSISWTCAASGSAVCGPAATGVGNAYTVTTGTLPVNASAGDPVTAPTTGSYLTYTVTATPTNVASISNTASITVNDLDPANNSSTWTNTQRNVRVDKSGPASAFVGESFDYSLVVTNNSTVATSASVIVRDQLPPGVIATSASGANCGALPSTAGALLTCTLAGGAIPANGTRLFALTVTAPSVPGSIINYAATNPAGSGNPPTAPGALCNVTTTSCSSAPTTIEAKKPELSLTKSHAGEFNVGTNGVYTLQVTNNGDGATTDNVTVVDTLPAGLGFVSATGTDWSCSASGQTVTCTTSAVIAAATAAAPIILTVSVAETALPGVINSASVSGGGDASCPAEGRCNTEDPTVVTSAPSMTVLKTAGTLTGNSEGDTIAYSFLVTNTGNVTISDITIVDDQLTTAAVCPVTTLAPTETTTCTGTYALTQADINAGEVINTATAEGVPPTAPGGPVPLPVVTPPSTTTTPILGTPSLSTVKSVTNTGPYAVGDTIAYQVAATNTGNVTLVNVVVSDPMLGGASQTCLSLAPGDHCTLTGSYVVQQSDVDAGGVVNTALVGTDHPDVCAAGGTDPMCSPTTTTPMDVVPGLALVKSAAAPSGNAVGATIAYSFLVTNTGNVTISDLVINDDQLTTAAACPVTTLAPTETTTCTGTYVLTQADVNAGEVINTATAEGVPPATPSNPTPGPVTTPPSTTTTTIDSTPSMTVLKTAGTPSGNAVGATIAYSFLVTNTGNVTISDITINDDQLTTPATCPVTTLAPTETTTCTGTYVLTQADVNAGEVVNVATAEGTPPATPSNPTPTPVVTPPSTTTTPIDSTPSMTVVKSAGTPSSNAVGATIAYSFLVTNTGNVTISDLVINDDRLTTAAACPVTTLAPTETTTCTGTYVLTQADVNAGEVINTATAEGVPPATPSNPTPGPVTTPPSTTTTVIDSTPSMTVLKTAGTPSGNAVGATIAYSFLVTNTGNVTISDITIVDDQLTAPAVCPVTTLAPTETTTCTGTYVLTQADVNAGEVVNVATAEGVPPSTPSNPTPGPVTTPPSTTTTTIDSTPSMTVLKSAGTPSGNAVGATIDYSFLVTNTGNVTISDITIVDDRLTTPAVCPVTTLAPAATTTCTGTYVLTQADVNAGEVINTATAEGTPPATPSNPTPDPVTTPPSTTTTVIASTPSMTVVKSAGTPSGNAVGATIAYEFLVTNTGNVTISDLIINDDQLTTPAVCPVTALAPTETTTCTGTYVLTQADVNAGEVVNVATAEGIPPSTPSNPTPGPVVTPPSTTTTTIVGQPSIASTKLMSVNADEDGSGTVTVGDTLTYTVTATNTGNVTLTDVEVVDTRITPASITCASLDPGTTCVLSGSYVVTAADAEAGVVLNTAVVTDAAACPVDSTAVECRPSVEVPVIKPQIDADDDSDTTPQNTPVTTPVLGNDHLNGSPINPADVVVEVVAQPEHGELVVNPDGTITYTPAPGYSGTDTYQYQVCEAVNPSNCATATVTITILPNVVEAIDDESSTQADTPVTIPVPSNDTSTGAPLDPGSVTQMSPPTNGSLTVNPDGSVVYLPNPGFTGEDSFVYRICDTSVPTPVCDEATVVVTVTGEAALRLVKSANVNNVKIGDLVRYTLTVENVGVANITAASVLDTPPAGFSYVEGSLVVTDGDNAGTVSGQHPLRFEGLDIAVGQKASLVYLMRVGAGVRPGSHINQAQAYAADGETPLSNVATAEVALVADALIDDSLLLGTVFDDRDGDGWQDRATLDNVQVQGGFAASAYVAGSTTVDRGQGPVAEPDASSPMLHGIKIGQINGRASEADPAADHQVVISQRLSELAFSDDFVMTSKQGITVRMDAAGDTTVEHQGDAAKGLTAAAPTVERRVAQVDGGYAVDYVITNTGIDERGIPGVRIASVEGLLIETDQYGRYHLAGVAGGDWARGRNFILKVDPSTLPAGAQFTTDNPLIRRITPGLPVRFDFGVKLPVEEIPGGEQQVEMTLQEMLFAPGSAEVQAIYLPAIDELAGKLVQYGGGDVVISASGREDLALTRASAIKALLVKTLPEDVVATTTITAREDVADEGSTLVGLKGDELLLGNVLFDTDKSVVRPQFQPLIEQVAAELQRRGGGTVVLVGHTDLRGSAKYNLALGLRRSTAVYQAIAEHLSPEVRAGVRVESSNDAAAPAAGTK